MARINFDATLWMTELPPYLKCSPQNSYMREELIFIIYSILG